jgi:hypothetical protein
MHFSRDLSGAQAEFAPAPGNRAPIEQRICT